MKLLNRIQMVLTFAAVAATGIMVCLTTADAIGRYLFARPIIGAYEVSEKYLMLGIVFLGLGHAYQNGAFIRVTILVDHLPKWFMGIINHLVQLFSMFYILVLVVSTILQVIRTYANNLTFSTISQPLWPACAIIPLGLFLMFLLILCDLPKVKSHESPLFKDDAPTT